MKIIGNPTSSSGRAKKRWPEYKETLENAGFDFDFVWTEKPGHAIEIAKEASESHKLIATFGGDGTVNEVITGIGQSNFKSTLAILPVGRGNDNAFNIRMTKNLDDLVDMLNRKEVREIDCIDINDGQRFSMGVAGAGLDADVSEQVYNKGGTRFVYYLALVRSIFRYRPRMMKIDVDNGAIVKEGKVLTAMVGNGQMIGAGMLVTPNAIIDDGLLDIMVVGNTGFIDTLITSAKLGKGTHLSNPKVNVYRGKTVTFTNLSKKKIYGHAMGEYVGELPIKFTCLPKKLKILKMSDEILEREGWLDCNAFAANVPKE